MGERLQAPPTAPHAAVGAGAGHHGRHRGDGPDRGRHRPAAGPPGRGQPARRPGPPHRGSDRRGGPALAAGSTPYDAVQSTATDVAVQVTDERGCPVAAGPLVSAGGRRSGRSSAPGRARPGRPRRPPAPGDDALIVTTDGGTTIRCPVPEGFGRPEGAEPRPRPSPTMPPTRRRPRSPRPRRRAARTARRTRPCNRLRLVDEGAVSRFPFERVAHGAHGHRDLPGRGGRPGRRGAAQRRGRPQHPVVGAARPHRHRGGRRLATGGAGAAAGRGHPCRGRGDRRHDHAPPGARAPLGATRSGGWPAR